MELITILSLTIGNAIAKAIITSWLDDNKLLENITTDLMDLVRDQAIPDSEKKNTITQVEEIGQQIVARLQSQFAAMPERSDLNIEAVIYEVAITVAQSDISLDVLIQHQLEPNKLYSQLRAAARMLPNSFPRARWNSIVHC
jgi:hypothetical protein